MNDTGNLQHHEDLSQSMKQLLNVFQCFSNALDSSEDPKEARERQEELWHSMKRLLNLLRAQARRSIDTFCLSCRHGEQHEQPGGGSATPGGTVAGDEPAAERSASTGQRRTVRHLRQRQMAAFLGHGLRLQASEERLSGGGHTDQQHVW